MIDYTYLIQTCTFYSNGTQLLHINNANGIIQYSQFISNQNATVSDNSALKVTGSTC